jgi:hypothetical protein
MCRLTHGLQQFVAWLSQGDATVWQAKSLQQVF